MSIAHQLRPKAKGAAARPPAKPPTAAPAAVAPEPPRLLKTGADLEAWMRDRKLTNGAAARALGFSIPSIIKYRRAAELPRHVALAVAGAEATGQFPE